MFKSMKYEAKKALRPWLCGLALALLVINAGAFIQALQNKKSAYQDHYDAYLDIVLSASADDTAAAAIYEEQEAENARMIRYVMESYENGTLYTDAVQQTLAEYGTYSNVRSVYMYQYEALQSYKSFIQTFDSRRNAAETLSQSSYTQKNILKTINDYKRVENISIKIGPFEAIELFLGEYVSTICTLVFSVILAAVLFICDYETSLFPIILINRKSRWIGLQKMAVLTLGTLLFSITIFSTDLIAAEWILGLGDLQRSVQSLPACRGCIFPVSISEFLWLCYCIKAFVAVIVGWIVFSLYLLVRKTYRVITGIAFFSGVAAACYYGVSTTAQWNIPHFINPFFLLSVRDSIGGYQNLQIFGHPVTAVYCNLFVLALCGIGSGLVCFLWFRKCHIEDNTKYTGHLGRRLVGWFETVWDKRGRYTGLMRREAQKSLINQYGWIVLLLCAAVLLWMGQSKKVNPSQTQVLFQQYCEQLQGPVTEQTYDELASLRQNLEERPVEEQAMYSAHYTALNMVEERLSRLEGLRENEVEPVLMDINSIEELTNTNFGNIYTVLFLLSGIVLISSVFSREMKSLPVLRTTKYGGKKLFLTKEVWCLLVACTLALLCFGCCYYRWYRTCDVSLWDASCLNVVTVEGMPDCSLRAYFISILCIRLLSLPPFVLLLTFLSGKTQTASYAVLGGIAVLVLPVILLKLGINSAIMLPYTALWFPQRWLVDGMWRVLLPLSVGYTAAAGFGVWIFSKEWRLSESMYG